MGLLRFSQYVHGSGAISLPRFLRHNFSSAVSLVCKIVSCGLFCDVIFRVDENLLAMGYGDTTTDAEVVAEVVTGSRSKSGGPGLPVGHSRIVTRKRRADRA